MALALEGEVACGEGPALGLQLRSMAGNTPATGCDSAVLDHRFAVDQVDDALAAKHQRLRLDPFVSVEGRRLCAQAVLPK